MRNMGLVAVAVVLFASSPFVAGCSEKPIQVETVKPEPLHAKVYFVMNRPDGFVAYMPEGAIRVGIKFDSSIIEAYVEVRRYVSNGRNGGFDSDGLRVPAGTVLMDWSFSTLYVKDKAQLKELLLVE